MVEPVTTTDYQPIELFSLSPLLWLHLTSIPLTYVVHWCHTALGSLPFPVSLLYSSHRHLLMHSHRRKAVFITLWKSVDGCCFCMRRILQFPTVSRVGFTAQEHFATIFVCRLWMSTQWKCLQSSLQRPECYIPIHCSLLRSHYIHYLTILQSVCQCWVCGPNIFLNLVSSHIMLVTWHPTLTKAANQPPEVINEAFSLTSACHLPAHLPVASMVSASKLN